MIVVNVKTVPLNTKLKLVMDEADSMRKLMMDITNKTGENF